MPIFKSLSSDMKNEKMDIKQLGVVGRTKEKILEELKVMYETV